jgi:predicted ATP-grasp superfamily ATP-dependent carboligase
MRPARVLVTDAEHRSVVGAVRGLLLAGHDVTAASSKGVAPGQWLRGAKKVRLPDPGLDALGFVEALEAFLRQSPHELLLAGSEASILAVSAHRELIEPLARHGLPPPEVVERSFDKVALLEDTAAYGLAAPESRVCADRPALDEAVRELGLPLMLKPERSLVPVGRGLRHESSRLVRNHGELTEAAEIFGFPLMAQRSEPEAPVYSFGGVAAGNRLLGLVFARYERTWPPRVGNASFAETLDPPPALVDALTGVLRAVGWEGIFELELLEFEDGRFAAIDFNPRVYGSLALAVRAGANFPAIWCAWLDDGSTPGETVVARPGFRYRLEEAEMRNFLLMLRSADFRTAAGVLRPRRNVAHAYFWWSDPGPLVARVVEIASKRRAPGQAAP